VPYEIEHRHFVDLFNQTLNRFSTFELNVPQSAVSRKAVDELIQKTKAMMWISHDLATYNKRRRLPIITNRQR